MPPMYPGGMRIGKAEESAVLHVLRSKRLFRYYGPKPGPSSVEAFEQAFAARIGVPHAVAVSSGMMSIVCGLAALGVGPGCEVIVPAYTWIASAAALMAVGAVPILAEVDASLTLDVADVESKIYTRTRAIMAVHMLGAPCRMDAIADVAQRAGLHVLEDVAQAIGGSHLGRRLGSIGDVGAFSFQFNKIITCGEGGATVSKDADHHRRIVMYHDVGAGQRLQLPQDEVLCGINVRMNELSGAVMLAQLQRLEGLLADMRRHKAALRSAIADVAKRKGVTFRVLNDAEGDTATSLVVLAPTAEDAVRMARALNAEGAQASVLYEPGRVDYHLYPHWPSSSPHGRRAFAEDACPRSLGLLGRAVRLDVSPDMARRNVEELSYALIKVMNGCL